MGGMSRFAPLLPLVLVAIAVRLAPLSWALAEALFLAGALGFVLLEWRGRAAEASAPNRVVPDSQAPPSLVVGAGLGVIVLGALALGWAGQPAVGLNYGLGWDGREYHAVYEYFRDGTRGAGLPNLPFHQRVGVPFLAAALPLPDRTAFLAVQAAFWIGSMGLFYPLCRKVFHARREQALLGVLWLQVHWLSVTRGMVSYAYTVDSAGVFFTIGIVALVASRRWMPLLVGVGLVAGLFKESAVLWLGLTTLALLGERAWLTPRPPPREHALGPLWAGLATVMAVAGQRYGASFFPEVTGSAAPLVVTWAVRRLSDPTELIRYPACILAALGGGALLAAAWRFEHPRSPPSPQSGVARPALWWLLASYLAVCLFSGSDLTRFAWLSFPLALPLLMSATTQAPPWLALPAFLLGLPSAYPLALIQTPAPPGLPDHDTVGPYSWMLEYAHLGVVAAWFAWFGFAWVVLRFLIRWDAARAS